MRFLATFFSLAVAVTAIDIRFTDSDALNNCRGYAARCTQINPNVCCSYGGATVGMGFDFVPDNWSITKAAYLY